MRIPCARRNNSSGLHRCSAFTKMGSSCIGGHCLGTLLSVMQPFRGSTRDRPTLEAGHFPHSSLSHSPISLPARINCSKLTSHHFNTAMVSTTSMTKQVSPTPTTRRVQPDTAPVSRLAVRPLKPQGTATPTNNAAHKAFHDILDGRTPTITRVSFAEVRTSAKEHRAKGQLEGKIDNKKPTGTITVRSGKVNLQKGAKPDQQVKDGLHAFCRRGDKAWLESVVVDKTGECVLVLRSVVLSDKLA